MTWADWVTWWNAPASQGFVLCYVLGFVAAYDTTGWLLTKLGVKK